jgi:hypothetical protein
VRHVLLWRKQEALDDERREGREREGGKEGRVRRRSEKTRMEGGAVEEEEEGDEEAVYGKPKGAGGLNCALAEGEVVKLIACFLMRPGKKRKRKKEERMRK